MKDPEAEIIGLINLSSTFEDTSLYAPYESPATWIVILLLQLEKQQIKVAWVDYRRCVDEGHGYLIFWSEGHSSSDSNNLWNVLDNIV